MAILTKELVKKYQSWEGGYQRFTNDVANYNSKHELVGTNMGVGALTYEDYLGRVVTIDDMKNMPSDVPEKIMRKYWNLIQGNILKTQVIAEFLLDWFWGSGYTGIQWFQAVLKIRMNIPLKIDYKFEGWEAEDLNNVEQEILFNVLQDERIKYTDYIIKNSVADYKKQCIIKKYTPTTKDIYKNTYLRFEKGWKNRINSYHFL